MQDFVADFLESRPQNPELRNNFTVVHLFNFPGTADEPYSVQFPSMFAGRHEHPVVTRMKYRGHKHLLPDRIQHEGKSVSSHKAYRRVVFLLVWV